MSDSKPEALFSEGPDGEYHPAEEPARKDNLPGAVPEDDFDRRDDQAMRATGQDALEASGVPRLRAGHILNSRAAQQIIKAGIKGRAEEQAAEEKRRREKKDDEIRDLLRPI